MTLPRQILFWTHLVTGLVAGLAIGIMAFTGVVLAFETEIVAWAERDARRVAVPADPDTKQLPLAELQARFHEAQPEVRSPAITLHRDPAAAIAFAAGRDRAFYADPYTGEIRQPASTRVRDFLRVMLEWHRYLGRDGGSRPAGELINGVCNLAFCGLAITGLYLWMPRRWSWRSVRAVALINRNLSGRARDFNWHNAIGLWCAPVLIVLTLTAVPISFRWGGNLIYRLFGEAPPASPVAAASAAGANAITRPSPEARPLAYDTVLARVQRDFPEWQTITLRSGPVARGAASGAGPNPAPQNPSPLTVTIREANAWPRTANTTLLVHPFTGDVLQREGHDDLSPATRVRRWTRFLHTGQALGWGGQFIAGLACLGGVFLVYTGLALSWRRFFRGPRVGKPTAAAPNAEESAAAITSAHLR